MMVCFQAMHTALSDDGVLTVMFTHKKVEAWDTLGSALLNARFTIDASWPVHTESEHSLHQAKKSVSVVLNEPGQRRKRGMVDADAEAYPHLIDTVHTAMMVYDEEGSKACGVFADRQGLRSDSRAKALVQAMVQAIPTTRDKDGKFLRGEMATLDALRLLFWDDLPAPKGEEPPKIDPQMKMAGFEEEGEE